MGLKEGTLLMDIRVLRWRILFLKAFISARKQSEPLHIFYTNFSNHVIKEESRGVRIAKTSLRVFVRMARS